MPTDSCTVFLAGVAAVAGTQQQNKAKTLSAKLTWLNQASIPAAAVTTQAHHCCRCMLLKASFISVSTLT